jgi:hypothetical protein
MVSRPSIGALGDYMDCCDALIDLSARDEGIIRIPLLLLIRNPKLGVVDLISSVCRKAMRFALDLAP